MKTTDMGPEDVRVLARETVFQGYFRVERYRLQHRLFEGGWSAPMSREVFERGHAAGLLPYDPLRDEVVLIEQFRVGALGAGEPPWQTEIVAGIIETGEAPEAVARREAEEEAGLRVGELVPIQRCLLSQGVMTETVQLFCGRVDAAGAGGIHGLDHEDEDIRVLVLPFSEAATLVAEGRIGNAVALVALQWLMINREELRARWQAPATAD